MVTVDLESIRENIRSWDDAHLIEESSSNIENYTDDVKAIIFEELKRRNIDSQKVTETQKLQKEELRLKKIKNSTGIKGVLLVFVLFLMFGVLQSIITVLMSYQGHQIPVVTLAVNILYVLYSLIVIVLIFLKRRAAVILLYIYLSIVGILSAMNVGYILLSGNGRVVMAVLGVVSSLIWLLYFNTSERVKNTLVR
jgi:hypothetical protein